MHPTEAPPRADLATWLRRLESLHPVEMDLGLARVAAVWHRLGAPRPGTRVITVAGTNGKGSTVATLDAVLRAAGLRTATTTSPHLHRFNERIVLDGREARDDEIVGAFERIEAARGEISLTYFEFAILAALDLMARCAPDVAVLEVGLGGRLDAVNIVDADLAVITAVDLDHQAWLGDDRETIGAEKAGILRPGRPLVIGDRDPPRSVLAAAMALEAPTLRIGVDFDLVADGSGTRFDGVDARGGPVRLEGLPVPGLHPDDVAAALQALLQLDVPLQAALVAPVLAGLTLAGRRQRLLVDGVDVLLDVAHNPHAARALAAEPEPGERLLGVFGTFRDKDAAAMLAAFEGRFAGLWLVDTPGTRGRTAAELAEVLRCEPAGPAAVATAIGDAGQALALAVEAARRDGGRVLVFGSFTVVAAVLAALENPETATS